VLKDSPMIRYLEVMLCLGLITLVNVLYSTAISTGA